MVAPLRALRSWWWSASPALRPARRLAAGGPRGLGRHRPRPPLGRGAAPAAARAAGRRTAARRRPAGAPRQPPGGGRPDRAGSGDGRPAALRGGAARRPVDRRPGSRVALLEGEPRAGLDQGGGRRRGPVPRRPGGSSASGDRSTSPRASWSPRGPSPCGSGSPRAAFGLFCLAGRRRGRPEGMPRDRVAWIAVALLLGGAAL